jgi:hypothetical protein
MNELKKKSPKKEREEYQVFIPYLEEIFKLIDPGWDGESEL